MGEGDSVGGPAALAFLESNSKASNSIDKEIMDFAQLRCPILEDGMSDKMPQQPTTARFKCKYPGCKKGANRRAALDRHYKIVHLEEQKKYLCDYKNCIKHTLPFFRQCHFREHLRYYHGEDLVRRGNRGNQGWWTSRAPEALHGGWWRCSRCLVRVSLDKHSFVCPDCKIPCEKERQDYRTAMTDVGLQGDGDKVLVALPEAAESLSRQKQRDDKEQLCDDSTLPGMDGDFSREAAILSETEFITLLLSYQQFDGSIDFGSWAIAEKHLGKEIADPLRALSGRGIDDAVLDSLKLWTAAAHVSLVRDLQSCKSLWELMAMKAARYCQKVSGRDSGWLESVRSKLEGLKLPVHRQQGQENAGPPEVVAMGTAAPDPQEKEQQDDGTLPQPQREVEISWLENRTTSHVFLL